MKAIAAGLALILLVPQSISADDRSDISTLIDSWRQAWEAKDINAYMAFYAPEFQSENLDYRRWKAKKQRLFRQPGDINVEIASLNIMAKGDKAVAGFIQRYTSPSISDLGDKILVLTKTGEGWRIRKENWRPLKDLPPGVSFESTQEPAFDS